MTPDATDTQREAMAWCERQAGRLHLGLWEVFMPDAHPDACVMVALEEGWFRVGRRAPDGRWYWDTREQRTPYWGRQ